MTRLSFSVKHILALQEHGCYRHTRAAREELRMYKHSSKTKRKLWRLEVLRGGRKARGKAWSCADHSFTRWSFLFHRHDADACLSCCSLISPEVEPLTCDGKCIMCRRKDQGLSRRDGTQRLDRGGDRVWLIVPLRRPLTRRLSAPFLTSKPDFKTADDLTQHQGEKWNNSPGTQ